MRFFGRPKGVHYLTLYLAAGPRSPLWRKVRAEHLKRQPVCQACGGIKKLQVHHMRPFHLHPELELDPENLITLCEKPGHDCHFVFGHFHNWSLFNPNVIADVAHYKAESDVAHGYVETDVFDA